MQPILTIKHKDEIVAYIQTEENYSKITQIKLINPEIAPFLGNFTIENANVWWSNRPVSSRRSDIMELLEKSNSSNVNEYMIKHNGLSLTDCYWISADASLKWDDVNLFNLNENMNVAVISQSLFNANASLNGQMKKHWMFEDGKIRLFKQSDLAFGQQNVNELIATEFHKKQNNGIEFVSYDILKSDTGEQYAYASKCDSFCSEQLELVSAYEVIKSAKKRNDVSSYEQLINVCVQNGLNEYELRNYLEYLIQTDFILDNKDRHLTNIAVLRNSDTLEFVKMSPIYDTGNSMYYDTSHILNRYEHLSREIFSFTSNFANSLKNMQQTNIINPKLILNTEELYSLLTRFNIPEVRKNIILRNYKLRNDLFLEFQNGLRWNMYEEKNNQSSMYISAAEIEKSELIQNNSLNKNEKGQDFKKNR